MRLATTIFILGIFCQFSSAQINSRYSKIRIYYETAEQLEELEQLGLALEHGKHRPGHSIENVFSDEEIELIQEVGINYEVLIPDLQQYYLDQNNPNSPDYVGHSEDQVSQGVCASEPIGFYPSPENFHLGSMGGFLTYNELIIELDEMYAYCQAHGLDIMTPRASNTKPEDPEDLMTFEGRYQQWVKITDQASANEIGEPQVLYTALHHAREPASMQQLVFFMWYLIENYETDETVRQIVDETELYFIPCVNPDGYIFNEAMSPNGGGLWRKNRYQGYGVDNNRNYSYITPEGEEVWGGIGTTPYTSGETFPGSNPFSEAENRAVRFFVETHQFSIALNNHTHGELLLFPYGYATNTPTSDHNLFAKLSRLMVSENNYENILSSELYPHTGICDDFMYGMLQTLDGGLREKILSFTPEIGDSFWPASSKIEGICAEMVYTNILAARFAGPYATIKDLSTGIIPDLHFNVEYELTSLGSQSEDITVWIEPVSNSILNSGPTHIHNGLGQMETAYDLLSIELRPEVQIGDSVIFDLVVRTGGIEDHHRIEKLFGHLDTDYVDDIHDLEDWQTSSWGLTEDHHPSSPHFSITDSPIGDYANNIDETIELIHQIDLSGDVILAELTFFAKWSLEKDYDYVQIEASINGEQWLPLCGQYTNTGRNSHAGALNQPLYDGEQGNWIRERIDLNEFIGQAVSLRFQIRSDGLI
ncbi:MAG: M14 family zinc carboxypeptidase, partial [Bacteroidota bacterium]